MRHAALLLFPLMIASPALLADPFLLVNGDRLTGTIINRTADSVTIDHPLLGQLVISNSQLADNSAPPVAESNTAPAVEAGKKNSFKRRVEAGLNGANGNSRNSDWRLGFLQRAQSSSSGYLFESGYRRATSDGNTEENDLFAQLTFDWLLPDSRWIRFARGRYDWDDFEDWDSRLSGSAGYGYRFETSSELSIATRIGLGATQTFGGSDDDLELEGLFGIDGEWHLNGTQQLEFANTFYQRLEDLSRFRNLSSLAWIIRLDQFHGIDLKLGLENEYESRSPGNSRNNDLKYDLSLTWQLQ